MLFIDEMDLKNKRVFFRFDYNVPMDRAQNITDDSRIRATLPTLNYALDEGAKIIIASHLGRPKGKVKPEFSLAPVAKRLSRLLQKKVVMAGDCIGEETAQLVANMVPGDVILLENLRFHPEEEKNDDVFARQLAAFADIYIDDAFGNAHRAHASNVAITNHVPVCGGGFLLKKEITYFQKSLENPARPFVAIIGGSKVSGKLEALSHLLRKVDKMIIGGGMAFTFPHPPRPGPYAAPRGGPPRTPPPRPGPRAGKIPGRGRSHAQGPGSALHSSGIGGQVLSPRGLRRG
jgi:phosphoglycerate kinase